MLTKHEFSKNQSHIYILHYFLKLSIKKPGFLYVNFVKVNFKCINTICTKKFHENVEKKSSVVNIYKCKLS
jgi:hypothetical protein